MYSKRFAAELTLALIALIWGTIFVLTDQLLQAVHPSVLNVLRFGLAALVTGLALVITRTPFTALRRSLGPGTLLGACAAAGYLALNYGLPGSTPGQAAFLVGSSAVAVPLLGTLLLRDRLHPSFLISAPVTLLGLALLGELRDFQFSSSEGLLALSTLAFALHVTFTGRFSGQHSPAALVTVQSVVVTLVALGDALRVGAPFPAAHLAHSPGLVLGLFVLAVPATALAYLAQTAAQQHTSAPRVAAILLLEPVFGAATDYLVNGQTLTPPQLCGCGLILGGIAAASLLPLLRWSPVRPVRPLKPREQPAGD